MSSSMIIPLYDAVGRTTAKYLRFGETDIDVISGQQEVLEKIELPEKVL